ncbi:MAG: PaaI family thioesterase [Bacteroidetes bacterium]|nr:MAG: PaaI family thioesterase [Bacteroidota bacterium]
MNKTVEFFKAQIGKEITQSPSPVGMWLRPVLLNVEEGSIKTEIMIRPEMTNPAGMLHGGMIALISDEIIGATIATLEMSDFYPSVNLYTDFLNGAKLGEKITVETIIIRKGKNIINTECKIYNSHQKLIAKSQSNNIKANSKK